MACGKDEFLKRQRLICWAIYSFTHRSNSKYLVVTLASVFLYVYMFQALYTAPVFFVNCSFRLVAGVRPY